MIEKKFKFIFLLLLINPLAADPLVINPTAISALVSEQNIENSTNDFANFIRKSYSILFPITFLSHLVYSLYSNYKLGKNLYENKTSSSLNNEKEFDLNEENVEEESENILVKNEQLNFFEYKNYLFENKDFFKFYSEKGEQFINFLDKKSEVDFLIVYGNPYCGKTSFIENNLSDILLKNDNIFPIKVTKNSINLIFNYANLLKENDLSSKDKLNKFVSELNSLRLNSKNEENLFIFYFDFREFIPYLNGNNQESINEFNKNISELISNMKSFFELIDWLKVENKFLVKFIIEIDTPESFNNLTKIILTEYGQKKTFKSVVHLDNLSKKDLFIFYKDYLLKNNILMSDHKIKRFAAFSSNFSLIKSIVFIEHLRKKMLLNNLNDVDENFITEFFKFFTDENKFENFIEEKIFKKNNSYPTSREDNNFLNKYEKVDITDLKFEDVAGNFYAKEILKDFIDYLKNPEKYLNFGIKIEKGILFKGPPGTGKTLLAKALAAEANIPFFYVGGSDFDKIYVGTGAENIKRLFKAARECAPSIIFIDEIDILATNRDFKKSSEAFNQILVELGEFKDDDLPILVIGATNSDTEKIDPALLRPGRLGKIIEFKNPFLEERLEILKVASRDKFLSKNLSLEYIAKKTNGFSGAEIVELLNSAAKIAMKKNKIYIELEDLNEAFETFILGFLNPGSVVTEKMYTETAIHELGHVFCMIFNKNYSRKFDAVSILPRDWTLGVTHSVEEDDFYSFSKEALEGFIICSLGGLIAEKIFMKTTSAGVSNDLEKVKKIATNMVTQYGMKGINLIGREENNEDVIKAVSEILEDCYQKAHQIIDNKKELLEILTKKLVQEKVLYGDDIKEICEKNGYGEEIVNI